MKPFDLEKAKAGAKLCTRDGRPARIVCYDMMFDFPILALILEKSDREFVCSYTPRGKFGLSDNRDSDLDLFLATTKREGWVNMYIFENGKVCCGADVFDTKEEAIECKRSIEFRVDTIHIEWEEY